MTAPSFVHLRAHTQYSIVDGLLDPDDLVGLAAEDGQPAVAMTDLHRMFGAIQFYKGARKQGVKPILGVDAWVDPDVTQHVDAGPTRLLLLAEDDAGYQRLLDWVSRSYLDNQRNGQARIKQSWLAEGTDGLIALSGGVKDGEIGRALTAGDTVLADKAATFYKEAFPGRFFLEVQRIGLPEEDQWVPDMVDLSQRQALPLVATHPVQFAARDDFFAHEVRSCIATKETIDTPGRKPAFSREQYFKSRAEMAELFSDLPVALENSLAIAQRCSSSIQLGKSHLPDFPTPNGEPLSEFFRKESRAGLEERLVELFPDETERATRRAEYEQRLEFEMGVIEKMGFPGYFMVVSDFIRWAKDQKIPVGPGRGSGAGSLVAYSLKITDLDPLRYALLFERFLNPDRVSMPDFDIDFDADRRGEVIDYVYRKYGEQCVAQIATFGTFKAKAAVRNAGRALNLPFMMVDGVAKLLNGGPKHINDTLDDALGNSELSEQHPEKVSKALVERYTNDRGVRRLIEVAKKIEGRASNVGKHAGGVIIAPGRLTDFTPLYTADADESGGVVSQYDKDDVEYAGLVKFDFLGLSNLTVIDQAVGFINRRPEFQDKPFDLRTIPIDDAQTFARLSEADSIGVFQLESSGMQRMLKQAKPNRFEDIIALVALFRPGPLALIPEYCARKFGQAFEYPDPRLDTVLGETYGIMVYQEQVMQAAQVLAGYSLGEADLLRRAMGKKKPEEMVKHRITFTKGAIARGMTEEKAKEIFDLMEKFADYGFNKSHAAAYALISYQTSYLKTHYPSEYYAAFMNVVSKKQDKVDVLLKDARAHGLKMLPPDVNEGIDSFQPVEGGVRYGLAGLKGVNAGAISAIVKAREAKGKFTSFVDFCEKVGRSVAGKTLCEALVRGGAFDSLHENRAALFDMIPATLDYTAKLGKQQAKALESSLLPELFGDGTAAKKKPRATKALVPPVMNEQVTWNLIEQLNYEKMAVGFFLSGHPFDGYAAELRSLPAVLRLSEVDKEEPSETAMHLVAGIISKVHTTVTRSKGTKMAIVTIDDGEAVKEVMMFSEVLESATAAGVLRPGQFIAFEALIKEGRRDSRASFKDGEGEEGAASEEVVEEVPHSLTAQRVFTLEQLQVRSARQVHVAVLPEDLPKLQELADRFPAQEGAPSLRAVAYMPNLDHPDKVVVGELPAWRMACTEKSLTNIKQVFGDQVMVEYARDWVVEPRPPRFQGKGRRPQR